LGKSSAGWHCNADLIGMELSFDIFQNLVAFDTWEALGSFQYVSVQLRHTSGGSHAPRGDYEAVSDLFEDSPALLALT